LKLEQQLRKWKKENFHVKIVKVKTLREFLIVSEYAPAEVLALLVQPGTVLFAEVKKLYK